MIYPGKIENVLILLFMYRIMNKYSMYMYEQNGNTTTSIIIGFIEHKGGKVTWNQRERTGYIVCDRTGYF